MYTYVLLMVIMGYQSGGALSHEFTGIDACENAAQQMKDKLGRNRDVIYSCVPKNSSLVK